MENLFILIFTFFYFSSLFANLKYLHLFITIKLLYNFPSDKKVYFILLKYFNSHGFIQ